MANKTHFPRAGGNVWVQSFYQWVSSRFGVVGDVYWVDSNSSAAADDSSHGRSPEAPYATIAYAVAHCTADNGDIVVVAPKHTEAVIAAGTITMSVAGVTVYGLGEGRQRGSITYTTNVAASFDITAARCVVENLTFIGTGIDALTAMINVSAADVTIKNCEIEFANATNQAVLGILTTAAADRFIVDSCYLHGSNNAGTATAIRIVGGDSIRITNNIICGSFTTTLGGIQNVTTAGTNMFIRDNIISNFVASASVAMTFVAATTGQISKNHMQVLTGTAPIVGANMSWAGGNSYANTLATAATAI